MLRAAACDVRSCCDGDVRAAMTATAIAMCELRVASCEQRDTEARGDVFHLRQHLGF